MPFPIYKRKSQTNLKYFDDGQDLKMYESLSLLLTQILIPLFVVNLFLY
jgi:hypothetical protein